MRRDNFAFEANNQCYLGHFGPVLGKICYTNLKKGNTKCIMLCSYFLSIKISSVFFKQMFHTFNGTRQVLFFRTTNYTKMSLSGKLSKLAVWHKTNSICTVMCDVSIFRQEVLVTIFFFYSAEPSQSAQTVVAQHCATTAHCHHFQY